MRVIEWLMSVESSGGGAHQGWMRNHRSALSTDGGGCRGGVGLGPLHRLEVFVFLHQLSSQFTIYLPWTVLTFSSFHLWQIPDTLGQASLETSYSIVHTTVSERGSLHMAPTHWIGLFLCSHINLSSIRQVGGSSGRRSQTSDRSSSQPLALLICRERNGCGSLKWRWVFWLLWVYSWSCQKFDCVNISKRYLIRYNVQQNWENMNKIMAERMWYIKIREI